LQVFQPVLGVLPGQRVTYHNAENRFCVAKQRKRLKENWLRSVNFRFYFEISM